jgi:hypothetical protein
MAFDSNTDPAFRWDVLATDETNVQVVDHPDAQEVAAKIETWTFCAIAPGKAMLYFGYITIGEPNAIAVRSHSVLLTINL